MQICHEALRKIYYYDEQDAQVLRAQEVQEQHSSTTWASKVTRSGWPTTPSQSRQYEARNPIRFQSQYEDDD